MTPNPLHVHFHHLDEQRLADEAVGQALEFRRVINAIHAMPFRSTDEDDFRERVLRAITPIEGGPDGAGHRALLGNSDLPSTGAVRRAASG